MQAKPQTYAGDVGIILRKALSELEHDAHFDPGLLAYLNSCLNAGTLGDERMIQKHLEVLTQGDQP